MIGPLLRQPCTSFTAEGTYVLKLDFLDEVALPNLPQGARVSIVSLKPDARAAVAGAPPAPAPPAGSEPARYASHSHTHTHTHTHTHAYTHICIHTRARALYSG
jgi:hypothetical protein